MASSNDTLAALLKRMSEREKELGNRVRMYGRDHK